MRRGRMRRPQLYQRIRQILESARTSVARSVNTTQVVAYWLIGREIVEEEQKGQKRAGYGEALLQDLAQRLKSDFGSGYSVHNLKFIRQFYLEYPTLMNPREIGDAARSQSWKPGRLHPNLSWTHYRTLLRVDKAEARAFYEIEALKNNWAARELERQINSLLYERLALSKDKKGLMRLAIKGHEVQRAADVFKDPVVMEFLGLPESPRLVETALEQALIGNLQAFPAGTGQGFCVCSPAGAADAGWRPFLYRSGFLSHSPQVLRDHRPQDRQAHTPGPRPASALREL